MTFQELQDLLEARGRQLAAHHGHTLGALEVGSAGLHAASCSRCGAVLLVAVHGARAGSWGAACRIPCRGDARRAGDRRHLHAKDEADHGAVSWRPEPG